MFPFKSTGLAHSSKVRRMALVLSAGLALACGDDTEEPSSEAGSGGAGTGGTAGAAGGAQVGGGATTELYGNFAIRLVPEMEETSSAAMTAIIGKVSDGPTPTPTAFVPKDDANGCTLLIPQLVFCDPACGGSAVCVEENMCTPYATAQTVGTVRLTGLGAAEITMEPVAGNYQPKAGTNVPFPPCKEGDTVELKADGGAHAGFTISAKCIPPLDFKGPVAIAKGQPLSLKWTAATQPALSSIGIALDISHHGGTKGKIECDVPDNGSLEIPAALVDALVELGVAGFPTIKVSRTSVPISGSGPKNVTLTISATVERAVEIPGLTSCASTNSQCPAGQTCQTDLSCK